MNRSRLFFTLILGCLALRILFFAVSVRSLPATTDEVLTMMIASSIAEGNWPILFWGAPYQFPLESYLIAPLAGLLPNDSFGARLPLFLLALLGTFFLARVAHSAFEKTSGLSIPAFVLFPSAYVVTLQTAYFIPEYTMSFALTAVLSFYCFKILKSPSISQLVLLGLLAGIGLSTHLLILPLVAAISIAVCLANRFRALLKNSLLYIFGLVTGLVPYFLSFEAAGDFAGAVTGSYAPVEALERLVSPLMQETLSTALGYTLCVFPDYFLTPGIVDFVSPILVYVFAGILLLTTIVRGGLFVLRLFEERWPRLEFEDVIVGATWAGLLAFAFSTRADENQFRYLLPVAWLAPLLFGVAFSRLSAKYLAVSTTAFFVLLNSTQTGLLTYKWSKDGFAEEVAGVPDLAPVIDYLDSKDISHCYASFWYSNRFTYETDGRITCTQPYNERFHGYPLPFTDLVNQSDRFAYILTNTFFSRYREVNFKAELEKHRIAYDGIRIGDFYIYHDFSFADGLNGREVEKLRLSSNVNQDRLERVNSQSVDSGWKSERYSKEPKWLRVDFDAPKEIFSVIIRHQPRTYRTSKLAKVDLQVLSSSGEWITVMEKREVRADSVIMRGTHPLVHDDYQTAFRFPPVRTRALRLITRKPFKGRQFSVSEISILETDDPKVPVVVEP